MQRITNILERRLLFFIIIACLQGGIFYALVEHLKGQSFLLLYPVGCLALFLPPAFYFLSEKAPDSRRLTIGLLALAMSLAVMSLCISYYHSGDKLDYRLFRSAFTYSFSLFIFCFISMPFLQIWMEDGKFQFPYSRLYELSWRNAMLIIGALVFAGIFQLLLGLWSGLFYLIGINIFSKIFFSLPFSLIAQAVAFSVGFYLLQTREKLLSSQHNHLLSLFIWLTPMLSFISVIFMIALIGGGLAKLWAAKMATPLIASLQALMILFYNAGIKDGTTELPFKRLKMLVLAAIAIMPVYSLISIYGLGLRIAQYGWSADRIYGMLTISIIAIYSFGYSIALLNKNNPILLATRTNVFNAVVILALLALINTPVLKPERIAASSQVARLLSGKQSVDIFDFKYLRFDLGRPGIEALKSLSILQNHNEAEKIKAAAMKALQLEDRWSARAQTIVPLDFSNAFTVYPEGQIVDESFLQYIKAEVEKNYSNLKNCAGADRKLCYLLALDLNNDGNNEYIIFIGENLISRYITIRAFYKKDNSWKSLHNSRYNTLEMSTEALNTVIKNNNYSITPNEFKSLRIGGKTINFSEHD